MATIDAEGPIRSVRTGLDASISLFGVDLDRLAASADCAPRQASDAERAARFRFERDRRRYLAARFALRSVLAEALGEALHAIKLGEDAQGKPHLVTPGLAMHFNVSHSDGVALIVLSAASPVGVDVEVVRKFDDADGLATDCLDPSELFDWKRMDPKSRDRRFLDLWTRKEALLKAIGEGLRIAPSSFRTGFGPQPVTLDVKERTVTVWSIDLAHPGQSAAIAQVHPRA